MSRNKKQSAGILAYRSVNGVIQVFLVHPGGPFWKNKDLGAWSIPKGEYDDTEEPLAAAKREFLEETGIEVNWNDEESIALQPVKLKSGKTVHAWAFPADFDVAGIRSNTFPLEWPPRSGKTIEVDEVDKGEWFYEAEAKAKLNPGQVPLIEELVKLLNDSSLERN